MRRIRLAAALALVALAWGGTSRADQPSAVPPGVDAPTITLEGKGDADTELVHGWRHWGGGYRHWGGYHGGWGHYHGYRPWYGGYGYASYRPWYGGYGYGFGYASYRPWYGYGYSSYYQPYYSYAYYPSYYGGYYNCWINGTEADANVPAMPLADSATTAPQGAVPLAPAGKTYQYDGGPFNPVPLPKETPEPQKNSSPAPTPLKGHLVSSPSQAPAPSYAFPAYGQQSTPSSAPKTKTPASGFAFPAYGEQPKSSNFATGGQ